MAFGRATIGDYFINIVPSMDGFGGKVRSGVQSSGIGRIFETTIGVALGNALGGAFDAFMDSLGNGIARLDTINSFQRVMVALGESPEAAADAINQMKGALDGLPTATNDMAAWVQQIRSSGEPLDRATQLGIAMNDALLAGGQSAADVANAMDAYNTILARGTPDLMHWRALVTTSPAAIDQLAKSLLGAEANQMDLYEALNDGTISMDEFNDAVIRLNEEGGNGFASFEEQARAATGGIGTALTNVKNRLANAWAIILDAIGADRIAGLIDGISSHFKDLPNALAPYITAAADVFFGFIASAQETFGQLVSVVMPYVETFVGYFQEAWGNFQGVLQSDFMQTAIEQLSTAFQFLGDSITPFVNDVLMPFAEQALPALGAALGIVVVVITNLASVVAFVAGIVVQAITLVQEIVWGFIEGVINGATTVVDTVTSAFTTVSDALSNLGSFLSETFDNIRTKVTDVTSNVAQTIRDGWERARSAVAEKLNAIRSKVQEIWDNIKSKVTEKVDSIKEKISSGFESAKNKVTEVFNTIKEKIINPIKEAKDKVTGFIDDISSAISGVHLELPSIRLPHFSVSGGTPPYGIAGMGSLPHFSVSWYAQGGIIDKATLFGAGEKGAELIWPSYSPYLERYADAIASRVGGGNTYLTIDGSLVEADARLASLVGQVVDYAIGTYSMGRA